MKCLEPLNKLAEIAGTVIEPDLLDVSVDAPIGYVWDANGGAQLSQPWQNFEGQTFKAEACRELAFLMRHGLRLASAEEQADIEWDRGLDDPWVAPEGSPEEIKLK